MAVTASAGNPAALLSDIRTAISTGKVVTWRFVNETYLTHCADQWNNRAFFKPVLQLGTLVFNIVPPQGMKVSTEVYAIYHGRLIEMLLAHFDKSFVQAFASALPISGDSVG